MTESLEALLGLSVELARTLRDAEKEAAMMRHPSGSAGVLLTAADRCDRCPAVAAYRVAKRDVMVSQELDFCVHHWRKNFPPMFAQGWAVIGGNPDVIPEGEGHA